MVAGVGDTATTLFNAADGVNQFENSLDVLTQQIELQMRGTENLDASYGQVTGAIKTVHAWIDNLAAQEELAAESTLALKDEVSELFRGMSNGRGSVEAVAEVLRRFFTPEVKDAVEIGGQLISEQQMLDAQLDLTGQSWLELTSHMDHAAMMAEKTGNAIRSIPNEWATAYTYTENRYVNTHYSHHGDSAGNYHQGGLVTLHSGGMAAEAMARNLITLHGGGMPFDLKPNEVMAKLERREFVVQEPSVNPATLSGLRYINKHGEMPPAQAKQAASSGKTEVHIHIHVNGDVIGDSGALERVTEAAEAGVLSALKEGTEAGEHMVCADGVYEQDWNDTNA
jgi:hypothetical protein